MDGGEGGGGGGEPAVMGGVGGEMKMEDGGGRGKVGEERLGEEGVRGVGGGVAGFLGAAAITRTVRHSPPSQSQV